MKHQDTPTLAALQTDETICRVRTALDISSFATRWSLASRGDHSMPRNPHLTTVILFSVSVPVLKGRAAESQQRSFDLNLLTSP